MNDPWTWTTVWGLTVGAGGGMGRGGQKGKKWDNCYRITIKNLKDNHIQAYMIKLLKTNGKDN